jgi:hypothetical protein
VAVGLASREGSAIGTWQIVAAITGPFILLSAVSASVSLVMARAAMRRELRAADGAAIDAGRSSRATDVLAREDRRVH